MASLTSGLPSPSKRIGGSSNLTTSSSGISLKDYAKPFGVSSKSILIIVLFLICTELGLSSSI